VGAFFISKSYYFNETITNSMKKIHLAKGGKV
jgi:hypothetical protein